MTLRQMEGMLQPELADALASLLEEDALSFSWYEKDPHSWTFQVIFEAGEEENIRDKLSQFYKENDQELAPLPSTPVDEKDWVLSVYKSFSPLHLGRFYIYGSHVQEAPPKDKIPLCINAATAFGSGEHESTEGCLKALSLLAEQNSFAHPLDMGCGSGILTLAMASLWKVSVVACDNDPEAVKVTLENARINHLEAYIDSFVSDGFSNLKMKSFDIITANILAGPLCQMAGDAVKVLFPGGFIVLAGLLNRQAEDVIDAYRSQGTKLVDQLFIGDWSTLILRKNSHG